MGAELEAELREQLAEQEEALAAVRGALEAGHDPALAEVRCCCLGKAACQAQYCSAAWRVLE